MARVFALSVRPLGPRVLDSQKTRKNVAWSAFFASFFAFLTTLPAQEPALRRAPVFHYDAKAEGWQTTGKPYNIQAAIERYEADRNLLLRTYDNRMLPDRDRVFEQFNREWLEQLKQVDFSPLDQNARVDFLFFRTQVERELRQAQQHRKRMEEIAPLIPFAPVIVEMQDGIRRLDYIDATTAAKQTGAVLKQIEQLTKRINDGELKAAPAVGRRAALATERLQETLKRFYDFYVGYDPAFTWWMKDPYQKADAALAAYAKLVRERIAGVKADDTDTVVGDPVGREALVTELTSEYIPYSPEELIALAEKELAWCESEMKRASREMGFGEDWHKALDKVKDDYVPAGQQPALIRDLQMEAIDFIQSHQLLTVPDAAMKDWRIMMLTPKEQKLNPFFNAWDNINVSYPTDAMTQEQKMMSMRGNNRHFSRATVFHELVPGHHMQMFMTERYRPYRFYFNTPFWVEGWAFYWEMLLQSMGYSQTPQDRMGVMFWRMHRAARIIFSLSFHLGKMTAPEAIQFLITRVGHEPENAAAEVRRSFEDDEYGPLYQCAYALGGMQFMALRQEATAKGKMTDRQFHDAVMRLNSLPVELVRASILNLPLTREYRTQWKFIEQLPGH